MEEKQRGSTMTNAEKFEEVFGFDASDDSICCSWWDREYKKPEDLIQHVTYDKEQCGYDK